MIEVDRKPRRWTEKVDRKPEKPFYRSSQRIHKSPPCRGRKENLPDLPPIGDYFLHLQKCALCAWTVMIIMANEERVSYREILGNYRGKLVSSQG